MAMGARRVQVIIAGNLVARLIRGKPSVNFSALDMLAGTAFFSSHYSTLLITNHSKSPGDVPPKYLVMRKPSRNHFGRASAIPLE
jgi:hypothetical protein